MKRNEKRETNRCFNIDVKIEVKMNLSRQRQPTEDRRERETESKGRESKISIFYHFILVTKFQ